jgi:phage tail sheath protein FI
MKMSDYRHGAYADQQASRDYTSPSAAGTVPVYIGRAPVHQLADYSGTQNVPIRINSWLDAMRKIGYSEDWEDYDLCEAVYAHFRNSVNSIGPIIVINAMSPDNHKNEEKKTAAVGFTRKTAVINNPNVILKTIKIADKVFGTDFRAEYAEDGRNVILTDPIGSMESAEVEYYEADPSAVKETDVVAAINAGVPLVYYTLSTVPTILCSPGWSTRANVLAALIGMLDRINGHWNAWLNADLDASPGQASESISTKISAAIAAKKALEANTGAGAILWPMARKSGRLFHASTLNTVTMQRVDSQNGDIPYETPSNKQIDIDGMCFSDGTAVQFDQTAANLLNAAGIDTMTYWEGEWRMWGSHTMEYVYGTTMDARDVFDVNVRMMRYIENNFQRQYGADVDKPMTRGRKDAILNDFQAWMDGLIQDGALLTGTILFEESENPQSDLVEGNFVFSTEFTNPIPGKSLTNKVRWSASGLNSLFGGAGNA